MAVRWLSFIVSGSKVSRGTTGAIEVYHALRFLKGGEPLRPPLTGIVGDLVADFVADQCHGSVEMLWGGVLISPTASEGSFHRTCPMAGGFAGRVRF